MARRLKILSVLLIAFISSFLFSFNVDAFFTDNDSKTNTFNMKHSYIIIFDKNDNQATGTMANQLVFDDEQVNLNRNTFVKPGFGLVGWTTNPAGTGTIIKDEELITNLTSGDSITLYAKWSSKAKFDTGDRVNVRMKKLAGNNNANSSTVDNVIKKVLYASEVPSQYKTSEYIISASDSEVPIYMWYDSSTKTIYYGSDAEYLYINKDASYMFRSMRALQEVDSLPNKFIMDEVNNVTQMFWGDHELIRLDVSHWNTINIRSYASLFGECFKITTLDVSHWDTRNATTFQYLFNQCYVVTELNVSNFNTSNVTNMQNMFSNTRAITSLDVSNFDTRKVTNMKGMFDDMYSLQSLDVSNFNTSKVTTFKQFLEHTFSLTSINFGPNFDTSKATTMEKMFSGCDVAGMSPIITEIDISMFDTSLVSEMRGLFSCQPQLETIYVGNGWSTASVPSNKHPQMFKNDISLVGELGSRFIDYQNNHQYYENVEFAHVDGGQTDPGYFTFRSNP